MAHFAQLDQNNVVIQVIVVNNEDLLDRNGREREWIGQKFCRSLFGENTRWVQTSYNASTRLYFAGSGFIYDEANDRFLPPKPYESWVFDEVSKVWVAPKDQPTKSAWSEEAQEWTEIPDEDYEWNEATLNWEKI